MLALAIIAGVSFVETSSPMWTGEFWREFGLKVLIYGFVVEFVVILLAQFMNKNKNH